MQHNHDRVSFGSKLGAILAAAGSAVGLGNIWRFPYEAGNHGGAAFILIYLGCIFIFGLPIMVAEFTIGRRAKASTGGSFSVLAPGTQWKWVGYLGVLTGFLILGYYSVVAGWTLEYPQTKFGDNRKYMVEYFGLDLLVFRPFGRIRKAIDF